MPPFDTPAAQPASIDPPRDCAACPRLATFRAANRLALPDGFNGPVPAFGSLDASVLIVGLAPGLKGANRTGRPFTGDYAGDLLYETLLRFGFARGAYLARPDDGLALVDCRIVNAVRCVPPQNKPSPLEISNCRPHLSATLAAMPRLRAILALGGIAHQASIRALGGRLAAYPFAHGARHAFPRDPATPLTLFDSYHCSRYNTNTGVLTAAMFRDVAASLRDHVDAAAA